MIKISFSDIENFNKALNLKRVSPGIIDIGYADKILVFDNYDNRNRFELKLVINRIKYECQN